MISPKIVSFMGRGIPQSHDKISRRSETFIVDETRLSLT